MIRVVGFKDKGKYPNTINTTTSSKTWSRGLSPMLLGPVNLYGGFTAKNVENAWQFSKVYTQHNWFGEPNPEYWVWATKGWSDSWAYRYPMGKGAVPEYSWWNGKALGYIEARKEIYLPLYCQAVFKSEAMKKLAEFYKQEGEVTLLDYDGYDYLELGMTLEDVLEDPTRKMGHAFVLAMILQGVKV